ncbi:MAG: DUF2207 domain-containing protein [Saprospiraceae bacterium]|nr:DUF2207 domain-containing protein [Saprospiraceae bacterium]
MKQFLLSLYVLLCTCITLSAQGYTITSYDVDLKLQQDCSVHVTEVIKVNFTEERRGIQRPISKNIDVNGERRRVKVSNLHVENYNSTLVKSGNDNVIRIGDKDVFITGDHIYTIDYTLSDICIYEEDHTAFQYNVIGDWDTSIDTVTYRLQLPSEIELRYNNYIVMTGEKNENERNATINKSASLIYGNSLAPLGANEFITIAVKLPVDYIVQAPPPPPIYKKDKFWVLPALFMTWLIGFFRRKSNTHVEDIGEQFFPPEGFSPAEVGSYYDNEVNTEDIISLLPYWANLGYIKILGREDLSSDAELFFQKIKPLPADAPEFEKTIFDAVFEDEDMVILSELKNKIYASTYKASSQLRKRLHSKALYDESNYKLFHSGKLIALAVILFLAAIPLMIKTFFLTGAALIIVGIGCIIIHFQSPKKSHKGVLIQSQLLALKKFMEEDSGAKTHELSKNYPGYFEKMLPYAIAFGLDKSWLSKLETYNMGVPHWYYYSDPMHSSARPNFGHFSKSFDVPQMKSVFTSQPASSSGGSSSGGGFSSGGAGGGFGGGGSSW